MISTIFGLIRGAVGHDLLRRLQSEGADEHREPAQHRPFALASAGRNSSPASRSASDGAAARCGGPATAGEACRRAVSAVCRRPKVPTRPAASSIASAMPSSLRQISATSGASASLSSNWPSWRRSVRQTAASPGMRARSAPSIPRLPADNASGGRRWTCSPSDPQRFAAGRQDVHAGAASNDALRPAPPAVSMTCSQLSRISSSRLSRRKATRLGIGSRACAARPSGDGQRARHQLRIGQRPEIEEADLAVEIGEQAMGRRPRRPWSCRCRPARRCVTKRSAPQLARDVVDGVVAPDHPRQRDGRLAAGARSPAADGRRRLGRGALTTGATKQ